MVTMFGTLNNVPKNEMFNVWHCKKTKHYCKAKIILKITSCGILANFIGNWNVARGATIELHKF